MKIAITGDVHLTQRKNHPERYNALENILSQMIEDKIDTLIIAGDLFDDESQNYSEFDEFCKQNKYSTIKFYIIPGNHDPLLTHQHFTAINIEVINKSRIIKLGEHLVDFLFVPYMPDKTMGEEIAIHKDQLHDRWVLIGHGDYMGGMRDLNPYEPGIYMPLTRNEIGYYKPVKVILGHVHKSIELGKVYYTGSPCGMDINETGEKRFLIIDTKNLDIISKTIDTDYIFFNETLIMLPTEDEISYIEDKINVLIKNWGLKENEIPKARIRLKVKGYTSDRNQLQTVIKEALAKFTFYNEEEPDLTEVSLFNDPERIQIVEEVKKEIEELVLNKGINQPGKDEILEQALHIILRK